MEDEDMPEPSKELITEHDISAILGRREECQPDMETEDHFLRHDTVINTRRWVGRNVDRRARSREARMDRSLRAVSMGVMPSVDGPERTQQALRRESASSAPGSATGSLAALNHYRCVVVGDGGVGKTSMLLRFVQGDFLTDYEPTSFDSFTVSMALGDQWMPCTMTLVDTAGQETYDRLRTLTYSDADVFIVCFSLVDTDSFINVRHRWIPELREFKPKTPIILVGTQSDLRDKHVNVSANLPSSSSPSSALSPASSHIKDKEGKRLASKVRARIYSECSALTGEGLDKIFYQALMAAVLPKRKRTFWHRMKRVFAT